MLNPIVYYIIVYYGHNITRHYVCVHANEHGFEWQWNSQYSHWLNVVFYAAIQKLKLYSAGDWLTKKS